eukprot:SAG31_NODE_2382_length_5827_cov_1.421962_7_plen_68_part_00
MQGHCVLPFTGCPVNAEFSYPAIVPTTFDGVPGVAMTYTWNRKRIRFACCSVKDLLSALASGGDSKL